MKSSDIIEQALQFHPDTRDSDRKLMITVWEMQMGKNMHPKLEEFFLHKAISPETIRRTRQKLQQHGKYAASETVDNARFEKYKHTKAAAPRTTDPKQLGLT